MRIPPAAPSPPPADFPEAFREFIATTRPDLDPVAIHANFCDHYPEPKRTLALWKKWVRREHAGATRPSARADAAQSVTVPGRAGRDPELLRLEADRAKAVPPSAAAREKLRALRDAVAHGAPAEVSQ